MANIHPVEQLMNDCAAGLAVFADTVPHLFGGKHLNANGTTPRYVWVPTRALPQDDKITQRPVDENRDIGTDREWFAVHCWGDTHAIAQAMRSNVRKALNDAVAVKYRFENGQWLRSETNDSWVHKGEVFVLTCSLRVAVKDEYTPLDTLTPDEVGTVVPARVTFAVENTEDIDDEMNGEPIVPA